MGNQHLAFGLGEVLSELRDFTFQNLDPVFGLFQFGGQLAHALFLGGKFGFLLGKSDPQRLALSLALRQQLVGFGQRVFLLIL